VNFAKIASAAPLALLFALAACSGGNTGLAPVPGAALTAGSNTSVSTLSTAVTTGRTGKYAFSVDMSTAYSLINQTANAATWLNRRIQTNDVNLPRTVTHTFKSGSSLAEVQSVSAQNPGAPVIFYDIEHWTATPASEQADPVGSIAQAAQIVHAAGKKFGIVPDGVFMGLNPGHCTADINAGIITQLDWTQIDVVDIQAQALANNHWCGDYQNRNYGVQHYTAFVNSVVQYVRAKNPNIVILAHVGLRDSTPDWALNAADSVKTNITAINVTYPAPCTNCTLANLTTVINGI
jgi:hypothetical protein